MKAKIYQIEYQSNAFNTEYSINLGEARERLKSSGFVQMSKLEDNKKINLNEEYWECPEDSVFNLLKAKIVEIECINEILSSLIKNKTLTMQLLIDTGLNAFAAELLSESFDMLSDELKGKLPKKLEFVIGNCRITLEDNRQNLPVGPDVL